MITLYQFPISHYCEKIRWALDYKNIDYKICNLLPGLHVKKALSMATTSELPILEHNGKFIQNSSDILNYLDEVFPDKSLTPVDAATKAESLKWEAFVDKEVGINIRRYFYNTLLDHPEILIPIFSHQGPWYGKYLLKMIFPKLRVRMRKLLHLSDKTALQSKQRLKNALDTINQQLSKQAYLAGDHFSRADLSAAALLAPLIQPEKYGVPWANPMPKELQQTADEWADDIAWVKNIYNEFR